MVGSAGDEAVDLAAACGLYLDPWQQHALRASLQERADGKWAAFEVGLVVPRQNGKGAVLEARELAGLLLLPERRLVHSAHRFDTALGHFERMLHLIENSDAFARRVKNVRHANDDKHIEMMDGTKLVFKTRGQSGGRGLFGDVIVLDEAFELPRSVIRAMQPQLTTAPNPQLWLTSTPVNQTEHANGLHLAGVRERALAGDDPRLAWLEWSADEERYEQALKDPDPAALQAFLNDVEEWANANPGLGWRMTDEYIADEQRSFRNDVPGWVVERLGIGDWPSPSADGQDGAIELDYDRWCALADGGSVLPRDVIVGVGVADDRQSASVAAVGRLSDGKAHVELVESGPAVRWTVDAVRRLERSPNTNVSKVVVTARSDLGDGMRELVGPGRLEVVSSSDVADACARLADDVNDGRLVHIGQHELDTAARTTETGRKGGGFAWKPPEKGDVTALDAVSLGLWSLRGIATSEKQGFAFVMRGGQ